MASEAAIVVNTSGGGRVELGTASPRNKVKFLCSHGGRILPRPIDGNLKYVGGETRVVAVSRDISFSDLMKKLTDLFPGDMVLKYQILPEDLDTLVSVRSDEDLKHMIDEHDRHENEGTPKLRTFLFPAKPVVVESHLALTDTHTLEQRYIDTVNGIVRTTEKRRRASTNANSISSACPSPQSTSPDGHTIDSVAHDAMLSHTYPNGPMAHEPVLHNGLVDRLNMCRVQSSPNLYNTQSHLNNNHNNTQNNSISNQHVHQHPHSYYQNHQQHYHHGPGYQSPPVRVPQDPHKGGLPPWMVPLVPVDRSDMSRFYVSQGPNHYYHQKGNGGGAKYYDDGSLYNVTPEVRSRAQSPRLDWSPKGMD